MTIRKGESWGLRGALAADAEVVSSDWEAARAISKSVLQRISGGTIRDGAEEDAQDSTFVWDTVAEVGLTGGDLHRTLGSPAHDGPQLLRGEGTRFPVDVGVATLDDGRTLVFLAHLILVEEGLGSKLLALLGHRAHLTSGLWARRTVVAMNAAFAGRANLGPRAHPNDGRLDVTDGRLKFYDRRRAIERQQSGSHLPHPDLCVSRARTLNVDNPRVMRVFLDGFDVGTTNSLAMRCIPDAAVVVA